MSNAILLIRIFGNIGVNMKSAMVVLGLSWRTGNDREQYEVVFYIPCNISNARYWDRFFPKFVADFVFPPQYRLVKRMLL